MKTITQDNITYKYCYVKTRGTSWAYGYYPETQLIEAKAKRNDQSFTELIMAKNRNGATGYYEDIKWFPTIVKFKEQEYI